MKLATALIPQRPNLRDEVYRILRDHLFDLCTVNDAPLHLREVELARQLGVSRTPVREALGRLEQEGLIKILPRRGIIMTPISLDEYVAWLEVRSALEGLASRLAAERMGAADIAHLRGLFAEFGDAGVRDRGVAYSKANAAFHAYIIGNCGNPIISRIMEQYGYIRLSRLRMIERLGRVEASLCEHMAIIDAIERRDRHAAERLARAHVDELRLAVVTYIADDSAGADVHAEEAANAG